MPSPGMGAIASLDYTTEERQKLGKKSLDFECPHCGKIKDLLGEQGQSANDNNAVQAEAREIAAQVTMKGEANQEVNQNRGEGIQTTTPVISPPVSAPSITAVSMSRTGSDPIYSYMIAAIVVALAILVFRRLAMAMATA